MQVTKLVATTYGSFAGEFSEDEWSWTPAEVRVVEQYAADEFNSVSTLAGSDEHWGWERALQDIVWLPFSAKELLASGLRPRSTDSDHPEEAPYLFEVRDDSGALLATGAKSSFVFDSGIIDYWGDRLSFQPEGADKTAALRASFLVAPPLQQRSFFDISPSNGEPDWAARTASPSGDSMMLEDETGELASTVIPFKSLVEYRKMTDLMDSQWAKYERRANFYEVEEGEEAMLTVTETAAEAYSAFAESALPGDSFDFIEFYDTKGNHLMTEISVSYGNPEAENLIPASLTQVSAADIDASMAPPAAERKKLTGWRFN